MKKLFAGLVATGALLSGATASAVPVTLTDVENVNTWLSTWQSTSWTHNFTFAPAADFIYSAKLTISFTDDNDFQSEYAIGGIAGSWDLAVGEVDTGNRSFNINVGQVADGILGVWVTSLFGDFRINNSTLVVSYEPTSVPEPETLALIGAGLLSVVFLRRRRAANSKA